MNPKIRVTGILIEDEKILIVKQRVNDKRKWSLPGGTLELGETIEDCIIREMKEETGIDVKIEKLLYICDRIEDKNHVVHITFSLRKTGGILKLGYEPEEYANPITDIKMVSIMELEQYGFSKKFSEVVKSRFPDSGTYRRAVKNIGL